MKLTTLSRLFLLAGILILFFFFFGFYVISSIYKITDFNNLSYLVDRTKSYVNKTRIAKEEFLGNAYTDTLFAARGSNSSFLDFNTSMDTLFQTGERVRNNDLVISYSRQPAIDTILSQLKVYREKFTVTAALVQEKGFKNLGVEGKMREAIHFIEEADLPVDEAGLLTLRRHEKDFLLRKDPQYVRRFDADYLKFKARIEDIETQDQVLKTQVLQALETYRQNFARIVRIENQIGLTPQTGLRQEMTMLYAEIERRLDFLNSRVRIATEQATFLITTTLTVLFLALIITAIVTLRWLLLSIAKPVAQVREASASIADGDLSVSVENLKSSRLLKQLILSFDKIVLKFRLVMQQIEQISTRKIREELPLHDEKDEITRSLNQIIRELRAIDAEEEKRKWYNEGLAKFAELLRVDLIGGEDLYDKIVKGFAYQLHANQAALFVAEAENTTDPYLEMRACYAYDRKKFLEKRIQPGEGLAGTAWRERDTILLTEIPNDYVAINSGLGGSNPNCILIVPLIINDQVMGVIEMASFHVFEDYEIKLVEAVAENVASFIQNRKVNEQTHALLENSELLAQQLREQEEELRQNMEEMQATQEEMKRNEIELQDQIATLLEENVMLKQSNMNYSIKAPESRWKGSKNREN
jgi:GAF domain-containing protein